MISCLFALGDNDALLSIFFVVRSEKNKWVAWLHYVYGDINTTHRERPYTHSVHFPFAVASPQHCVKGNSHRAGARA